MFNTVYGDSEFLYQAENAFAWYCKIGFSDKMENFFQRFFNHELTGIVICDEENK